MIKKSTLIFAASFLLMSFSKPYPKYEPTDANTPRNQIPDIYKWDLSHIYKNEATWKKEVEALKELYPKLAERCQGQLGKSAAKLLSCRTDMEDVEKRIIRAYQYAHFTYNQDESVTRSKEMRDEMQAFISQYQQAFAYTGPEIKAVGEKKIDQFLKKEPKLRVYQRSFDEFFRLKDYVLSPKEENILSKAGIMTSGSQSLSSALLQDMQWQKFKVGKKQLDMNISNWTQYRSDKKRPVRESAAKAFLGSLKAYENVWAQNYANSIQKDLWLSLSRGYPSTLERKLIADEIPTSVYDNLIETVGKNLPQSMHRYFELRKKVLGYKDIYLHDNYVTLIPSYEKKVTYEAAAEKVVAASKLLGDEISNIIAQGVDPASGWIDIYPNKNKASGAYNWGVYDVHTYIKLNFDNSFDNMFTLMHELGHGLHFLLSMEAQPFVYHSATLFTAEMASTGMEMILLNYLIQEAEKQNDEEQLLYLYDHALNQIKGSLFRQTQFAEFERDMHARAQQNLPLTAEAINKAYADLTQKYYGPAFTLGESDGIEWAFVSHFYRSFYVYVYATSISAAISMAEGLEAGTIKPQDFISFLKAGSSESAIDIAKKLGVDMSKPDPVQAACDYFERILVKFEKLYAKKYGLK